MRRAISNAVFASLALTAIAAAPVTAQMTGGGGERTQTVSVDIDRVTMIKFGIVSPGGDYGADPGQIVAFGSAGSAVDYWEGGGGADGGYHFGIESIRPLGVEFTPQLSLGLALELGLSYVTIDWDGLFGFEVDDQGADYGIDFRLGPALTFAVNDQFKIDANGKVGAFYGGFSYVETSALINGNSVNVLDEDTSGGFGFMGSFGVGARFAAFGVGVDYLVGGITRTREFTLTGEESRFLEYEYDAPLNQVRLWVGFAF